MPDATATSPVRFAASQPAVLLLLVLVVVLDAPFIRAKGTIGRLSQVEIPTKRWHYPGMATLTLHNIPDALHDTLKRLARTHHRSVDEEAVAVIEQALPKQPSREDEIARIIAETDQARSRMKRFMTDEEIEAAKEEGRA